MPSPLSCPLSSPAGRQLPWIGEKNFFSPNPSSFPVDLQPGIWTGEETWTCRLEVTSHAVYLPDVPGEVIKRVSAPYTPPPVTYHDLVIEIIGRSDPKIAAPVI